MKKPKSKKYDESPRTLGEHIRKKRIEGGLLQKDVALLIGVSEDAVTYWENNRSHPQIRHYPAIIAFLGYYPFEKDITTVSGRIQFIRYSNGWSYERLAAEVRVDGSTVQQWHARNQVSNNVHGKTLNLLLQQCLSK